MEQGSTSRSGGVDRGLVAKDLLCYLDRLVDGQGVDSCHGDGGTKSPSRAHPRVLRYPV